MLTFAIANRYGVTTLPSKRDKRFCSNKILIPLQITPILNILNTEHRGMYVTMQNGGVFFLLHLKGTVKPAGGNHDPESASHRLHKAIQGLGKPFTISTLK